MELRVSGFSSFLVFGVPKKFSGGAVAAAKPFSHRGGAVTTREKDVVRDVKEKERAASLFELCCLASFLGNFGVRHAVPLERGCPSLSFVPPCCVCSSERIFNALI